MYMTSKLNYLQLHNNNWDNHLCGEVKERPNEEVQEKPISELLLYIGSVWEYSRNIEEIFCVAQSETCQERARPYMMKAVVNQLKYLGGKFMK